MTFLSKLAKGCKSIGSGIGACCSSIGNGICGCLSGIGRCLKSCFCKKDNRVTSLPPSGIDDELNEISIDRHDVKGAVDAASNFPFGLPLPGTSVINISSTMEAPLPSANSLGLQRLDKDLAQAIAERDKQRANASKDERDPMPNARVDGDEEDEMGPFQVVHFERGDKKVAADFGVSSFERESDIDLSNVSVTRVDRKSDIDLSNVITNQSSAENLDAAHDVQPNIVHPMVTASVLPTGNMIAANQLPTGMPTFAFQIFINSAPKNNGAAMSAMNRDNKYFVEQGIAEQEDATKLNKVNDQQALDSVNWSSGLSFNNNAPLTCLDILREGNNDRKPMPKPKMKKPQSKPVSTPNDNPPGGPSF